MDEGSLERIRLESEIDMMKLSSCENSVEKKQSEDQIVLQSDDKDGGQQHLVSSKVQKTIKKRQCRKKVAFHARSLLQPYEDIIPQLIEKPQKSKRKATNIPKFIIKIFYKTLPVFPSLQHNERLREFSKQLQSSITRFHLVELFGLKSQCEIRDGENKINRQVLRRLLVRNYDNILSNTHIQHKRIYMLFSKKMLLRLNEPKLVGNIEI